MPKSKLDVLVAGAGPVGLFSALALAGRDLSVRIIEEEWRPAGRSYAVALHPESLRLLHRFPDLFEQLLDRGRRVDVLAYYDGAERRRERRLGELQVAYPFVLALSQHDLESLLGDALRARGIEVEWNHRIAALFDGPQDRVSVEVHRLEKTSSGYAVAGTGWAVDSVHKVEPRFVIGADGHRSTVRTLLRLDWETTGPSELYAVFEFDADGGPPADEARFTTDAGGTSVLWPLPGNRWRWSLPVPDDGAPMWRGKSRLAFSVGEVIEPQVLPFMLEARLPWFKGTPQAVHWATTARFERRLAASFGNSRVWLAGDAAHLGVPLGVQSMNAGLREGAGLADCLAAIVHGGAPRAVLDDYGEVSRAQWIVHADEPIAPLASPLPTRHARTT